MRALKWMAFALSLALITAALSGCGLSSQVENQAYGIVIGLDREPDGQMRMCARIPKISGKSQGTSGGQSGGAASSAYALLDVTGGDFDSALEKLAWAAPRTLNLSHLKLIVLSEALTRAADAPKLIESISRTEHIFTSASIAVCSGSACDFVAAIEPSIGVRLSTDIEASLDHYRSLGFIPDGNLSELYYLSRSVYSDPMAIQALLNEKAGAGGEQNGAGAQSAFAFYGSAAEVSGTNDSESPTRYLGAAVFSGGRMCGAFTPRQTVMASLLRDTLDALHYSVNGQSVVLTPVRSPVVQIDLSSGAPRISAQLRLSVYTQDRTPDDAALRRALEADIQDVFRAAQAMGAEPFGFAECAAQQFTTLSEWVDYDWRARFPEASLELEIRFFRTDA